jgi:hypothetical protein
MIASAHRRRRVGGARFRSVWRGGHTGFVTSARGQPLTAREVSLTAMCSTFGANCGQPRAFHTFARGNRDRTLETADVRSRPQSCQFCARAATERPSICLIQYRRPMCCQSSTDYRAGSGLSCLSSKPAESLGRSRRSASCRGARYVDLC